MKVLHLLAAAAAVSAIPIHADESVFKVDSNGKQLVDQVERVNLDHFKNIDDLVEALKLNDFDNDELREQKVSLLEEIKSFENSEEALDYFRTLVTDTFNRVDDYFKPEGAENREDVPSKEDESMGDHKIGARPHGVKAGHRKGQHQDKVRPHHDKEFVKAVAHGVHHDEESFKHHGVKPHGVRPHHGSASAKSWTASFDDAVNYIKSYGQKPEDNEHPKHFGLNAGDDVPPPHYRHRKFHKGDSKKHDSEDAENHESEDGENRKFHKGDSKKHDSEDAENHVSDLSEDGENLKYHKGDFKKHASKDGDNHKFHKGDSKKHDSEDAENHESEDGENRKFHKGDSRKHDSEDGENRKFHKGDFKKHASKDGENHKFHKGDSKKHDSEDAENHVSDLSEDGENRKFHKGDFKKHGSKDAENHKFHKGDSKKHDSEDAESHASEDGENRKFHKGDFKKHASKDGENHKFHKGDSRQDVTEVAENRKYHKGDSRKHFSRDAENRGIFAGFIAVLGLTAIGGAVAKRVRNRRAAKAIKLEGDEEALPQYESEEESEEVSNEKN